MSTQKEQKTIMQIYGAFVASILCSFVPVPIVLGFGLCLFLAVLIAAYIYKARSALDSLLYNHMTYMIGTIWVGSLILLIGMALASYWVYVEGDHTAVYQMMDSINAGVIPTADDIRGVEARYKDANLKLLAMATAAGIGPGMVYMAYRIANAMTRASRGYRLAKPASWL